MTAVVERPRPLGQRERPAGRAFSPLQLLVVALATIAPVVVASSVAAALVGLISTDTMLDVALGAGENPGMLVFAAMFLASPVQAFTGRTQVRVRKYLGIVFFLLASSNGAMFVVEQGLGESLSAPFLVAGVVALLLALPLFLTSSRRAQRTLGMGRWRTLHRLTYVVAAALLAHSVLMGEFGLGELLILVGFAARTDPAQRWLRTRRQRVSA